MKSVSVEARDVGHSPGKAANGRMKGVLQPAGFGGAGVGHYTAGTIILALHLRSHHLQKWVQN